MSAIQAIDPHAVEVDLVNGRLTLTVCIGVDIVRKAVAQGVEMPTLTAREKQCYEGVRQGLANKEIAASLNLSERTVKFHVSSLLAKFNVQSRTQILMLGFEK